MKPARQTRSTSARSQHRGKARIKTRALFAGAPRHRGGGDPGRTGAAERHRVPLVGGGKHNPIAGAPWISRAVQQSLKV